MSEISKKELYEKLETFSKNLDELHYSNNEKFFQEMVLERNQLTEMLESMLGNSLDERIDAENMSDEEWLQAIPQVIAQVTKPFRINNTYDAEFYQLIEYIWQHSKQELVENMIQSIYKRPGNAVMPYKSYDRQVEKNMIERLRQMERPPWLNRLRLTQFFTASSFWGTFNPEKKDYNTFELRAAVLKQHSYDFLWLYQRLEDYLSKRTLSAILINWVCGDMSDLRQVKSIFPDYWDTDIFPDNKDDVFVDCGAYIGDSIEKYIKTYGNNYRKIYAYEIARESYEKLCNNMAEWKVHDVICKYKGTGRVKAEMFVDSHSSYSGNHLCENGQVSQRVDVVALDEDIEEVITLLKMDIEGAEIDTLLGCENTIRKHHPRLAICVYHGYDDLWRIPLMINKMYPDYHFYMRYNGAEREPFPTEFVLLCKA